MYGIKQFKEAKKMKENYTEKVDKLITELKKGNEFMFNGYIVDCIKEFMPISKSEIRTAFLFAGLKPSKEDIKFIYSGVGLK